MTIKLADDPAVKGFLEAHGQQKGAYEEEAYEALVRVVEELKRWLDEGDIGGIFNTGRYLEHTANALQDLACELWRNDETARILTEAIQKESSITEEKED